MRWFVIAVFSLFSSANYAKATKIIVWDSLYNNPTPIVMTYLQRALAVTSEEYGEFELIESANMEQGRSLIELSKLANAKLDVASYAPTSEREKKAIAIRIPLLSGLMGYRLCLIDGKNQVNFQGIKTKQQFLSSELIIGQHQNWPDTTILRFNNFPVHTTHKKRLLFQQLMRGRFDCFSRGASEIYAEYLAYQDQGMEIEKELLIYYPLPIFFFVNKSRPELAQRIELGLQKLIDSGEFEQIFEQFFNPINNKLKLTDRAVIDLLNPTLSEKTVESLKVPTERFRKKYFVE